MKSNAEWLEWGRRDPFWAVSTLPGRERGGVNPWTAEEFYAAGREDWNVLRSLWDRYGRGAGRTLDVGCGAGRITAAIDAVHVTGIDISPDMLAIAREHVPGASFQQSDGSRFPVESGSMDAVFSLYVLQHFAQREDVAQIIRETARVLAPGGTALLQIPIYRWPRITAKGARLYELVRSALDLRSAVWRLFHDRGPRMRLLYCDEGWVHRTATEAGLTDVVIATFRLPSIPPRAGVATESFLLVRKP